MTIQEVFKKFEKENKEILFTKENQLTEIGLLAYTMIGIQITTKFFEELIKLKKEKEYKKYES